MPHVSFDTFFGYMKPALTEVYRALTAGQAADLKLPCGRHTR